MSTTCSKALKNCVKKQGEGGKKEFLRPVLFQNIIAFAHGIPVTCIYQNIKIGNKSFSTCFLNFPKVFS